MFVGRKIVLLLCFMTTCLSYAADSVYGDLLAALRTYQNDRTDTNAFRVIYDMARSEDAENVVSRCMAIYTLHMGAINNAQLCQAGFQSLCRRYPDSSTAKWLEELKLFPEPCQMCQGVGTISKLMVSSCPVCRDTGKCQHCKGTGFSAATTFTRKRVGVWREKDGQLGSRGRIIEDYRGGDEHAPVTQVRCLSCKGQGICSACSGFPAKERKVSVQCPSCKGISKGVDPSIAALGLSKMCAESTTTLQQVVECEKVLADVMEMGDAREALSLLDKCLEENQVAFNRSMLVEARERIYEDMKHLQEMEEAQARKEQARLAEEQAIANAKEKAMLAEQEMLKTIRNTESRHFALSEIDAFLKEHSDSLLCDEAILLRTEIERELQQEAIMRNRNKKKLVAAAAILLLMSAVWMVRHVIFFRSGNFSSLAEASRAPLQQGAEKHSRVSAGQERIFPQKILAGKSGDTRAHEVAQCPECQGWLECPEHIKEENVVCGLCGKEFYVH